MLLEKTLLGLYKLKYIFFHLSLLCVFLFTSYILLLLSVFVSGRQQLEYYVECI